MILQQKPTSKTKSAASGHFIVLNDKGLHTRPATELVKCAMSFRCEITLSYQGLEVNAKSLLGILTLAATKGARVTVSASGEDAADALHQLQELARNKFYIHY